ncbi:MAG: Flp pilus assembly protein CpaB [Blastochloris sp.]|nr:Flp pilus assembly protein CpaB [Blastochloris sp.]
MKNKAFNVLIVLAILLGAASLFLINLLVKQARRDALATVPQVVQQVQIPMVKMLVAADNIPPGQPLTPLSVRQVDVPQDLFPESALANPEQVLGRFSALFIPKGDIIMTSKAVLPEGLPRAALMIDKGRRFVSVPVDVLGTSGYVIKNGDFVDLVGSFEIAADQIPPGGQMLGSVAAITFMQRVRVVDIFKGEAPIPVAPNFEADPEDGPQEEVRGTSSKAIPQTRRIGEGVIATFDVTPREAEIIMSALKTSQGISLVLRRFDDTEIVPVANVMHQRVIDKLYQLFSTQEAPPAAPPPPPTRRRTL